MLHADGQTDMKLIVAFLSFAKAPKERKPMWDLKNLHAQLQKMQDAVEYNRMWKCSGRVLRNVLDIMSGLVRKVEKRARKPWNAQEMISKVDE